MDEYLIWWTSQEECESVMAANMVDPVPLYIQREFSSRIGRAGRGRLWVPRDIELEENDWNTAKPASRLAEKRGGIVIRREDAQFVFALPGFLTDLSLNFINDLSE